MNMNMFKKGDIILVILVIAAILVGTAGLKLYSRNGSSSRIAIIKQNDEIIRRIDLAKVEEPETIRISGDYNEVILVEKGRIRFKEADCPDLVCVKTGWLSKPGDMAVCLPNRTIIKIEGEADQVDGVTY